MFPLEKDISPLSPPLSCDVSFTDEHQRCPLMWMYLLWRNTQRQKEQWIMLFFIIFVIIPQNTSGPNWIFLQVFKKYNSFRALLNLQFGLKVCHLSLGQFLCFFHLLNSAKEIENHSQNCPGMISNFESLVGQKDLSAFGSTSVSWVSKEFSLETLMSSLS